jgi:hypothetical protein
MKLINANIKQYLVEAISKAGAFLHFSTLFLTSVISTAEMSQYRSLLQPISTESQINPRFSTTKTQNQLIPVQTDAWIRKT